jgi:hypothetical protein
LTAGCSPSKQTIKSSDAFTAYPTERNNKNITIDSSVYKKHPHLVLLHDMDDFLSARDKNETGMQVFYDYDRKENNPANPIIFHIETFRDNDHDRRYTSKDETRSETRIRDKNRAAYYCLTYATGQNPYNVFDVYYEAYDFKAKEWKERAHYSSASPQKETFEWYLDNVVEISASLPTGNKQLIDATAKGFKACFNRIMAGDPLRALEGKLISLDMAK